MRCLIGQFYKDRKHFMCLTHGQSPLKQNRIADLDNGLFGDAPFGWNNSDILRYLIIPNLLCQTALNFFDI